MQPLLKKCRIAVFLLFVGRLIQAQEMITLPVLNKDNSMVLQTDKEGKLLINYFGKKLNHPEETGRYFGTIQLKTSIHLPVLVIR